LTDSPVVDDVKNDSEVEKPFTAHEGKSLTEMTLCRFQCIMTEVSELPSAVPFSVLG